MKKLLLGLVLLTSICFSADKTLKIGDVEWYTEENSIEEMLNIAHEKNKSILVVFSATWCKPCQHLKKEVFKSEDFSKVSDRVLLLYIEQTNNEKSLPYLKNYKIRFFPTVMLLNKNGKELDRALTDRSVKGILSWIEDVQSGKTAQSLEARLNEDPENPELILEVVKKSSPMDFKKTIPLLKKYIGFKDKVDHESLVTASYMLLNSIYYNSMQDYENREQIIQSNDIFVKDALYPLLTQNKYLSLKINWELLAGRPEEGILLFNSKKKELEIIKHSNAFEKAVEAYLENHDMENADSLISDTRQAILDSHYSNEKSIFSYIQMNALKIIKLLEKQLNPKLAEKTMVDLYVFYDEIKNAGKNTPGTDSIADHYLQNFANNHGFLLEKYFVVLDDKIKNNPPKTAVNSMRDKAKLICKHRDKEKGKQLYLSYTENSEFLDKLTPSEKSLFLNNIAWDLYEFGLADNTVLKVVEESVAIEKNFPNLDTLACVHSVLENYEKAIEFEKLSMALLKNNQNKQKEACLENLKKWEAQLKE